MPYKCVRLENVIVIGNGVARGRVVKVSTLSFLGDVDKERGVIISKDTGAEGLSIAGNILVANRFRGSTVGAYVLYALCKKGLAPKAILMVTPDPVVISGMILCNIIGVIKLPIEVYNKIEQGVEAEVRCEHNLAEICLENN